MDETKTVVLFRMWTIWNVDSQTIANRGYVISSDFSEELIAVFPELPASITNWRLCESFQHIGQHSACLYEGHIESSSRQAKLEEYASLQRELESHYGYNLTIADEITPDMQANRRKNWLFEMGFTA